MHFQHAVNLEQECNDPNYKKCYLYVIVSYSFEWCIVHLIVIRLSKSNEYQIKEWGHYQYCNKSTMDIFNRDTASQIK